MITEATKKVDVLIEALPYIKQFYGRTVVIKYGGSAVEQSELNHSVLEDITFMNQVGIHPILVHGAGPFISRRMKEAGVEVRFVNGIRATDDKALEIVEKTLGEVNRDIVRELKELGNGAKGFVGRNGELISALRKETAHDIGHVGEFTGLDTKLLKSLLQAKIIPVIAPLGVNDGQVFNLNADTVAAEIAVSMQAEKLVLLTNVRGIMRDMNDLDSLISSVGVHEVEGLVNRKVISGGMIPKVDACVRAAAGGVNKTHIIDAKILHALLLEIFTEEGIGTEIVKGE